MNIYYRFFKIKYLLLINFVIPNFFKILLSKEKYFFKQLQFNQKTFITGSGLTRISKGSSFGSKFGGFHHKGSIEFHTRYPNALINLGENLSTNNNIYICAGNNVSIGSNTLIGQNVCISDMDGHGIHPMKRREVGIIGLVEIGVNVWIGNNVVILKNSIIGDNCIVAAGAVVTGSFPKDVIIGGIPAKILRSVYDE